MKIEQVDVDSLKPASYNPRSIDAEEMASLKRSLKQFGFVDPAIIRKKDKMIIGGHQRVAAAKELGFETVPVIIMDVTANDAKLLNVALNKISGDWDDIKLANLLKELKYDSSVDELLTGFSEEELDTLLWDLGQDDLDEELREEAEEKLKPILGKINIVLAMAESRNDKAVGFVQNVLEYVRNNHRITKKQMEALNKVHKRCSENLFDGDE